MPSGDDPRNLRLMELAYHASSEQNDRRLKDIYEEMLRIIEEIRRELDLVE